MTWAFAKSLRLGTPKVAHHPLQTGGGFSRLHWFAFATACRVACLPGGSDRGFPQPTETFTSELSNGSVVLPVGKLGGKSLRWLRSEEHTSELQSRVDL